MQLATYQAAHKCMTPHLVVGSSMLFAALMHLLNECVQQHLIQELAVSPDAY